jgi:hypothetical protein
VIFDSHGLYIKWEHESKALQSTIHLGAGLFSAYDVSCKTGFGLPLTLLLDTLGVMASGTTAQLHLCYPGPNAELVLE